MTNFQNASPRFARKRLQFHHSKIHIKVKTTIFKHSEHLFLTNKHLENDFLNHPLQPTLDLNSFEDFSLLCQKIVSTLSLNNFEKSKKSHCQMFRAFIFDLKVALKPFSKFFLWLTFVLNRFEYLSSLFQKTVSTLSLKNFQKSEKCHF